LAQAFSCLGLEPFCLVVSGGLRCAMWGWVFGGTVAGNTVEVDGQPGPDDDPYDPAKPEYLLPATEEEVEAADSKLLGEQIDKLEAHLASRRANIPEHVAQHYELILQEMYRSPKGGFFSHARTRSAPGQPLSGHRAERTGHVRCSSEPVYADHLEPEPALAEEGDGAPATGPWTCEQRSPCGSWERDGEEPEELEELEELDDERTAATSKGPAGSPLLAEGAPDEGQATGGRPASTRSLSSNSTRAPGDEPVKTEESLGDLDEFGKVSASLSKDIGIVKDPGPRGRGATDSMLGRLWMLPKEVGLNAAMCAEKARAATADSAMKKVGPDGNLRDVGSVVASMTGCWAGGGFVGFWDLLVSAFKGA